MRSETAASCPAARYAIRRRRATRRGRGIPAAAIAEAIGYAIDQPATVDVNELVIRPTAQS